MGCSESPRKTENQFSAWGLGAGLLQPLWSSASCVSSKVCPTRTSGDRCHQPTPPPDPAALETITKLLALKPLDAQVFPVSGSSPLARVLVLLWSPRLPFSLSQRSTAGPEIRLCMLQALGSSPSITEHKDKTALSQPHPLTLCDLLLVLCGSNPFYLGSGERPQEKARSTGAPGKFPFPSGGVRIFMCFFV